MKYLRLFESISMKSYEEITDDEWSIFAHKWYESDPGENALTDKECQVIKDIINPYAYMKFDIKNQFISNYRYQLIILTDRRHIGDILIKIYKDIDEWFYVNTNFKSYEHNLYKCDQIDGLVDCLNDLLKNSY